MDRELYSDDFKRWGWSNSRNAKSLPIHFFTIPSREISLPNRIPLPHPSPRNRHWVTKNPWFETETLPALKTRVAQVLS